MRVPPSGLYNQVDPVLEPFIGAQFLRIVKGIIDTLFFIIWVLLVILNIFLFDK